MFLPISTKQVNNPQETENGIITLTADYPIEKDTLTLSEIADTVFYVKLQQQGISNNARIEYLDSLILVYDFSTYIRSIIMENYYTK